MSTSAPISQHSVNVKSADSHRDGICDGENCPLAIFLASAAISAVTIVNAARAGRVRSLVRETSGAALALVTSTVIGSKCFGGGGGETIDTTPCV
jgi:hypothetical protein